MIKSKKIDLVLDEEVIITATLKNGTEIPICCDFLDAEKDRLYLQYPAQKMQYAQYFYEGREVNVKLYTLNGEINYPAMIIYKPEDGLVVVEYYRSQKFEQKRKFIRVKTTKIIDIVYEDKVTSGTTIDLSASGCKFLSQIFYPIDAVVEADLLIYSTANAIKTKLKILEQIYDKSNAAYETIGEIVDISETDKKRIIKFCYDEQTSAINIDTNSAKPE